MAESGGVSSRKTPPCSPGYAARDAASWSAESITDKRGWSNTTISAKARAAVYVPDGRARMVLFPFGADVCRPPFAFEDRGRLISVITPMSSIKLLGSATCAVDNALRAPSSMKTSRKAKVAKFEFSRRGAFA
jgi:hypothetical protein